MNKRLLTCMAFLCASALMLTGCGQKCDTGAPAASGDATAKSVKMGFVYIGPIGDGGWTFAHNDGRLAVEKELGIETVYKESVPEGPEVTDIMRNMIDQGCTIIAATSFGYMDYMEELSKQYPDVKFLHCSGYKSTDNMANYFGRMYQARFLSGLVAGKKTQSNKLGYVAAFEIPEVVRGINAFTRGVRMVNPEAQVYVRWTHTWYDPAKEKEAAKALLDEGCDVIAQHQDTPGPQQAAEERGLWSVGYNTDMSAMAPKANMTSPVWHWGPYYVQQAKAVMDGTWTTHSYWGGLKDGIVDLSPLTDVAPEGAQALVDEWSAKIKDGSFHVFSGPINDQSGAIKVAAGEMLDDGAMLGMDWFVEGVVGKIAGK